MPGKRRDHTDRVAALTAAWHAAPADASSADFWLAVAAGVSDRLGYRLSAAACQMAAARLGLARRRPLGLASLRISAEAATCPHCREEFALAGTVSAAELVAFARKHGACRRAYNRAKAGNYDY